jgi:neutral ceramidase
MRRGRDPRRPALLAVAVAVAASLATAPTAQADGLRAGAGRADVTPPTGFYMFGWVRSDAQAQGQLTRLFARTIVLERGGRKVALVSADLGAIPNGLVVDAAERLSSRGFSERNVIVSASHTHSAPTGYFNYPAFNTVAPTDTTATEFEAAPPADPQLYSFLVRRLAASIRRADRDLGPAVAGWGSTRLLHLTENRSIEAHLANHGIIREFGQGSVALDPGGYVHTISPRVEALRVDKLVRGRRVPIGMWSTFADHGTVVKPTFPFYNADHHAAAARIAEAAIRRRGRVPPGQEVVNSYGNSDEGDITAGLEHSGPAGAHEVGRREARAMLVAWRRAGGALKRDPALKVRWTRACFCGRDTAAGPVDDRAVVGLPFLTGSEENRGPLYDETGVPLEGYRLPAGAGPQGAKVQTVQDSGGQFPTAVPLTAVQVADRAIVTVPGEMSSGMGRRLRAAVLAAGRGAGIRGVVVSGLANDFLQYFTTPEEYGRQHYEGGTMLFGEAAGVFVQERLAALVRAIADGEPAPAPDPFDPQNGVSDGADPYPRGAASGSAVTQPGRTPRLGHATFEWAGGERGFDRPLDRAFVTIQRRKGGRWRRADDDLGLRVQWSVSDEGRYLARWEPGLGAPTGRHRFLITANRYRLRSRPFRLNRSRRLTAQVRGAGPGRAVVELDYPRAVENRDLTWRPHRAVIAGWSITSGGEVRLRAPGGKLVVTGPSGTAVTLGRRALRDPHDNANRNRVRFELP